MRDLNYQLKGICNRNKDGSYATQAARLRNLDLMANQLHDLGFRHLLATGLKPKHVVALVELWKKESIAIGTVKNRMAHLRWWAEKVGKADMIPDKNSAYNIDKRHYVTNISKAKELPIDALDKITDANIKVSLQLQAAFGLRREECLKFQPSFADKGDRIILKGSWCKGGQQREIPIRNDFQRNVLDQAHKVAGRGSLIPAKLSYIQQVHRYSAECEKAGLSKMHGLRHSYAQTRYEELTGWKAPAAGGLTSKELTDEQKALDKQARLMISEELGHHRESITAVYLGR
ncbi:MAG: integrase domain-containing protein [Blastocatellia bacterium]|nr:integrase domain-containing protein [Blastocatellia bacterium]